MAKDKLTEYSATNASNDVIGDISVAEGMLPSAVNNALREQMTHLKNFSDGTDAIDALAVDNLRLDGNTISSTDTNGNITLDPNGTGKVGIETTSPRTVLDLGTTRTQKLRWGTAGSLGELEGIAGDYISNNVYPSAESAGTITYTKTTNDAGNVILQDYTDGIRFYTGVTGASGSTGTLNNFQRVKIDSSGNVLVGKTTGTNATAGAELNATGQIVGTFSGGTHILGRNSSDGSILELHKDGTTVGSINASSGGINLSSSSLNMATNSNFFPTVDDARDLGGASARWDDIYATNGTIQTSDANEKQQISALTDAEMTAAKAISQLFKTFKWNSAVTEKGDAARTHAGVIAQDVEAAMTAAGLDAGDYAFFISSTWWETQTDVPAVEAVAEVLDDDGNVVTEAVEAVAAYTRTDTYDTAEEAPEGATERTRLGIRYPELLAFVGAATEQRLANIETRLAALEA